ncbi:rho guanine nucleotide exchange factor 28-like isoform X3 [Neoarius graeffei]|uniref:rho guanine nucleotide exchange factor 28-like isoform X3 n=1 Tax=Neoarius graeffei TaxID=443677 RepID=UPI00298C7154|nr:rho guanine nucleotide exchange factor 28-like isoform X3 [Neoarius graeffei]
MLRFKRKKYLVRFGSENSQHHKQRARNHFHVLCVCVCVCQGQARVFVLIPSQTESEEMFVVLEGSSLIHVLQTKVHTLMYFITPGHNQQETVCVRAYTHIRGVLRYVGVSFLKYVKDDAQEMAEYFVSHSNQLGTSEYRDLIGRYNLSDSSVRTEMDKKVALALANLQINHNLLNHMHESLLHVCVRLGFVQVCEFLLSQPGALMVIHSANQEGDTPLQLAQQTNQHTLVHLLTHPPNPLVTPVVGVSHILIDSSHLLRFIHASGVMSLSMCVSECVSSTQLHSAISLLRHCVMDHVLIPKITSLCRHIQCRSYQESLSSSSEDLQSGESPHTVVTHADLISSCSDLEDEELLLSISSGGSATEANTATVCNHERTHTQKQHFTEAESRTNTLICTGYLEETALISESKLAVNERAVVEETSKWPVWKSTQTVTHKVPLKASTLSMLLCSSSHSSPSLFTSSHKNSTCHRRRRSNSEGCGHEMSVRKSWSLIGQYVSCASTPSKITVPAPLDYSSESWSAVVGFEYSHTVDRKTVKRQEVIYELMQTEFHHVQTLTVMTDVLRRGLLEEVQLEHDVIGQIFPCLDDLLTLHRNFLTELENRHHTATHLSTNKNFIIHRIGDILLQQFSGPSAGHMMALYGNFCSKQSEALKIYKQLQQSNRKLQLFLRQSSNSVIKRREIPEFLLLVTQRITKYPVLLERLLQHTDESGVEHDDVMAALEGVRCVLSGVELHVEKIQRARELDDIINRLDHKSFTRLKSGEIYSKHTLTHKPHTLTHSATLTCRTTSGRLRDVFVLLLSDVLVFLQEKEQKFIFAALEQKPAVVPLRALILREIANQDRGLFLISSEATEPEMYEIHTHSREERDRWITLLQHTTDSLPDNELKNNEEVKCKDINTLQEALLSLDVQLYAVLEEKLRMCVWTLTHKHLLIQTHTPRGATLLTTAQAEVVNLLVCVISLLFGYHDFIQHAEELSKKHLKQKESLIVKVVDCVQSLTQILYSLQAAVMMQDSVYEVQKLLIHEESLQPDSDGKVDDWSHCHLNMEPRDSEDSEEMDRMKREKEGLGVELQQWAERAQALREEEAGVERERRWIQQEERRIRKERERMERKLCLSHQNSTNRQRSLSIILLDK